MKKSETQPKAVQGTAMVKNEVAKPNAQTPALIVLPKNTEPTPEELKAEIEKLKRKLSSVPENLEDRINYYNQKKEWIKQLAKLNEQKSRMLELENALHESLEEDEFTTEYFSIALMSKKQYGGMEKVFEIQNPVLVGVLLNNIMGKMNEKIDELEINIAS